MRSIHWTFSAIVGVTALVLAGGCESAPKQTRTPTRKVLQITNHVGGAHYRTIIRDDIWYQTFSNMLLVIDPFTVQPITEVELGEFGSCGPAVDMAIVNGDLLVVLEDDRVVHLGLDRPTEPEIIGERFDSELGILPRRLSVVQLDGRDVAFVCGEGGAVRYDGGPVLLADQGDVGSVAPAEPGLVGTIGRRVYRLDNGAYVGAATQLMPLPGDDSGAMIFTQVGDDGALIGIMESNVRERNARTFTTAVGGSVRRIRCFDNSLWIVTDEQILAYTPEEDGLTLREVFRVRGARDVDLIQKNYLAVAGTFGRAVYRITEDENGPGDMFLLTHREPGLLTHAISDRLQIIAGTPDQGAWLYQIGTEAKLLNRTLSRQPPPSREAVTNDGAAVLSEDDSTLSLRKGGTVLEWYHPSGYPLRCVIAVEGRLWVGHDRGLAILEVDRSTPQEIALAKKNEQPPPEPKLAAIGDIRLHGPVPYLFALLTGRGAAYVATYGGLGTVEFIDEPIPTPIE